MSFPAPPRVALETTLLVHGVPRPDALPLADELAEIVRAAGAEPALAGVVGGRATVGMSRAELQSLLARPVTEKINTPSLGLTLAAGGDGASTVSATMELAALAGVRIFATGGLGGVHRPEPPHHALDVSADLAAFTRFPVAVVASGCKGLLDVISTREALEALGVPVVGWRTDRFPAFYCRDGGAPVDARFDDLAAMARWARRELARTARGVLICNPIEPAHEIAPAQFESWLSAARAEATGAGASGRAVTPAVLGALHRLSGGATLRANLALIRANTRLAAHLAVAMDDPPTRRSGATPS
ncbi:MAG: pseudouridine-5'-phosphate glycosidase [Phycisphaeraceae bacterium]|nr:pseudouridine-5'-phosphate glycosidase [Phycisphaeraceae bacterium]